jgi:hypothetical protein
MYTLRIVRPNEIGRKGMVDEYYCNLSTDWNKAVSKAAWWCDMNAMPLKGEKFALDEIERSRSEEKDAAERAKMEKEESERREREEAMILEYEGYVSGAVLVAGKYAGEPIEHVWKIDPGYVAFAANNVSNEFGLKWKACTDICRNFYENIEFADMSDVSGDIEFYAVPTAVRSFMGSYGVSNIVTLFDGKAFYEVYTTSKKILALVGKGIAYKFSASNAYAQKIGNHYVVKVNKIKIAK